MLTPKHRTTYDPPSIWKRLLVLVGVLGICVVPPVNALTYQIGIILTESCSSDNFSESVNYTLTDALNVLRERSVASAVEFTFTIFPYCDELSALADIDKVFGSNLDVIIGVTSYTLHNSFSTFSDLYRKPYVSANSFIWTRVTDYAFSTANSFYQSSAILGHILDYFRWQGVVSITTDDAFWYDLTTELYIQLNLNGFKMKNSLAVKSPVSFEDALDIVGNIETSRKAVVLCMELEDQLTILSAASNLSIGQKHAFFTFATSRYDATWGSLLGLSEDDMDLYRTKENNIMDSVFVIAPHLPGSVSRSNRNRRSVSQKQTETFSSNYINKQFDDVNSDKILPAKSISRQRRSNVDSTVSPRYLSAIFDSVLVLGYAVENYLQTSNHINESVNIINFVKNLTLNSSNGATDISTNAITIYDYSVEDYSIFTGKFETKIRLDATGPVTWSLHVDGEVLWPSDVRLYPDVCFKQDVGCDDGQGISTTTIIIIFIAVGVVCMISAISFVCIRRYLVRKEMKRGPHKLILSASDLTFLLRKDMGIGSRVMKSTLLDKPDLVKASEPNKSSSSLTELSDYTDTARFNGDLVHVKELTTKGFEMRSRMMDYMKSLRDLRHENINPYVALLVDPVKPALITEYCSRGSLQDVIRNEDIKLDWDFKYSLVIDLVRGLRYLHNSSLKWHGYLKSTNCVIDSRWVLKLTDYGLPAFLGKAKQTREQSAVALLWSAPEYIRNDSLQIYKGTEKGDVFSFAIIMQEVALRSDPYSSTGLTPAEIVKKLKKPPPLIRPSVSPQFAPPPYIQLMKQCWSELPDMRPGIEEVYDQFKKITSGKKANIVDTMFRMLEKYSNDLEEIVNDRTVQLEEEKKKTDQLLSRMLPPTVAEFLKSGKPVEAETFAEVTIYFSDIVGFTTISAMSTPMQVVDLLNDLYTMFDATIEQYEVYKVETIGDAYMVVSGIPTRIGYKHAGEISTMALDLLSQCATFKIRHMPDVPLRLRIGLHTGSCVAGVVGLTMPRYCLFGDTVNTASRMESTGSASRIHVSEETREVLCVLGGYQLEFRGMTELKGKGKRNTYWLTGKEGFTKPLPEPPDLSEDNHGLASVLSIDNLSTMINHENNGGNQVIKHATITETQQENSEHSSINGDENQSSVEKPSKEEKSETLSNAPPNKELLPSDDSSTNNKILSKNTFKADVIVENPPKQDSSITKPAKPPRKISPSALSLSDSSIHATKSPSAQNVNSFHSSDNIPNSDINSGTLESKNSRNSQKMGSEQDQIKPRKLEIVPGKTYQSESNDCDNKKVSGFKSSKASGRVADVQLIDLDETQSKRTKKRRSPISHLSGRDKTANTKPSKSDSSKNENEAIEQRISDISVSTVISVVSTSDIEVVNDKLDKCQNDKVLRTTNKSSSSENLPPVSNV